MCWSSSPAARAPACAACRCTTTRPRWCTRGSRVGVNLRGLDRDDIARGDWLVAPELAGLSGRRFDAWVSVLPGARPLRSGDQVRLHHGTAQYLARVAPLEGREICAGHAAPPRSCGWTPTPSCCRTTASSSARSRRSRPWPAARRCSPARSAGTRASGTAPSSAAVRAGDARAAIAAAGGRPRPGRADSGRSDGRRVRRRRRRRRAGGGRRRRRARELTGAGGTAARWFGAGVPGRAARGPAGRRRRARRRAARTAVQRRRRSWRRWCRRCRPPTSACCCRAMVEAGELVAGEGGYAPAGAGVLGDAQAALAARHPGASRGRRRSRRRRWRRSADELGRAAARARPDPRRARAPRRRRARRQGPLVLERGGGRRPRRSCWPSWRAPAKSRWPASATPPGCGRRNAQALLEYFDREGLTLRRGDVRVARRRRS